MKHVNLAIPTLLSMLLLAACGGGGGDGGGISPPGAGTTVTVAGTVTYDDVPPQANCSGLNFNATTVRPIRGATVVLLSQGGAEIARTTSSDTGAYSFAGVAANANVQIRVLAESKRTGSPGWDVEVRDNVDLSASPPALGSRPLYALDGGVFNSGSSNATQDLRAGSGWNGGSYTGTRAAAPFAILDTIYTGLQFLAASDPSLQLPPLDVFWSVNNGDVTTSPNLDTGELGGSFYIFDLDSLFITGDANFNTSEFDDHVVGHEWGHFLDDTIFRSDSSGGTHFLGDKLDSRLAWGEGWPTALATFFLDDPVYCSTTTPQGGGFGINAEGGAFGGQGWFDEVGVTRFVYDLWDTTSEGTDTGSVGFQPIYDVMTGGQRTSSAWTNIFTFSVELKAIVDANGDALIDAQLGDEQTVNGSQLDIWGSNETNDGGASNPSDVLPMYIDMVADGTTTNICSDSQFDTRVEKDGNKIAEFRYIRLSVPLTDQYNVTITSTTPTPATADPDDRDQSDPDMYIYQNGVEIAELTSGEQNIETTVPPLGAGAVSMTAGTYIADLRDWRYADPERPPSYPAVVCFDVRFDPTP